MIIASYIERTDSWYFKCYLNEHPTEVIAGHSELRSDYHEVPRVFETMLLHSAIFSIISNINSDIVSGYSNYIYSEAVMVKCYVRSHDLIVLRSNYGEEIDTSWKHYGRIKETILLHSAFSVWTCYEQYNR